MTFSGASRRAVAVSLASLLVLEPVLAGGLAAQASHGHRVPRRVIFTIVGAAVATIAAGAYFVSPDQPSPGLCTKKPCVMITAVGGGAFVGYLIGREFDQLHALRYRGGAPLHPNAQSIGLSGEPTVLAVRDSLVAIGGAGGTQILSVGTGMRVVGRRATGVRGIESVDLAPRTGQLAIGSSAGFYLYPPRSGPGVLVREGEVSSTAIAGDLAAIGTGGRVELAPLVADTSKAWPGVTLGHRVHAIAVDSARNLFWAAVDDGVIALRPVGDSLERIGRVGLGAPARRLSLRGTQLAAALGDSGIRIIATDDPTRPAVAARWFGTRFAYDVSLAEGRLFVASGVDGVYVLDPSAPIPQVIGLARDLGFAVAVTSRDSWTYVLDRTTNSLRRFPTGFSP